ncbi:hypothetical protein BDW42DRAFT_172955 [Aspergillus taichungensis]|uniref:Uncharacterized protein n=1 Tax=Aspergillus taichungensis TaxID=482145 RepID=A0A2J5HQ42_9EURO|nr:hypothetical protein BDW42DRAFT_172955 [Aspergillus taichungensis]
MSTSASRSKGPSSAVSSLLRFVCPSMSTSASRSKGPSSWKSQGRYSPAFSSLRLVKSSKSKSRPKGPSLASLFLAFLAKV